jgi:multidrug efflux pump subunit AcrA (membrane-fusion protein)
MHSLRSFFASRWMLYGPVLLIGGAVAGGGWFLYQQYEQRQRAEVEASRPKPAPDLVAVTYTGKIRAQKTVLIPAPVDGTLESIEAIDGEEVYEGQLLGRIQNTSIEAHKQKSEEDLDRAKGKVADVESQLLSARLESGRASADLARTRSEYEILARSFERQQKLFREGAAARKTFEKSEADFRKLAADLKDAEETQKRAEARVSAVQANVEEARAKLKELTEDVEDAEAERLTGEVKAPVAGLLIGHRKSAGEEVTRDIEDLFEIATDLTAMEIVAEIPAELAKKLKAGGGVLVQIAEAGPAPLNGTIREVSETTAIIEFVSPSPAIKPGMTGQVRFLN